MRRIVWSEPHHGVTHIESGVNRRFQYTVENHGTFATATVFPMENRPFTNYREKQFQTVEAAKAWLEKAYRRAT